MSHFTSDRERRLWASAVGIVVAICATLGLAGTLPQSLIARTRLDVLFVAGFVLVIGAIVGSGWRTRPTGREVWALLGIAAAYGMVFVRMGVPAVERTHLFEYGIVAVLVYRALDERCRNGRHVAWPAGVAVAATATLGWLDEAAQGLLPNRVYDIRDVAFNALAALMAVAASVTLSAARRRVVG